jgi:hypothetical protein
MTIPEHLDVEPRKESATTGMAFSRPTQQGGTTRRRRPTVARSDNTHYAAEQYPPDRLRDPVWLRDQYVVRRLGTHAIGRIVGRSSGTVAYHLRRHGIALRDRREAARRAASTIVYP